MSDADFDLVEIVPDRLQVEPFVAYKRLQVRIDRGRLRLEGMRRAYTGLDLTAECLASNSSHASPAPGEDCSCGFYGYKERSKIYYSGEAFATVELFGRVIVGEKGYRAQRQRIVHLAVDAECAACRLFGDDRRSADGLYFGLGTRSPVILCAEHGVGAMTMHAAARFDLEMMSAHVGVETVWKFD